MDDNAYFKHKKIFFLRPRHSIIFKIMDRVRHAGYEVHEIPGLSIMESILKKNVEAFLFINIEDKIISDDSWEYAVKDIKSRPEFDKLKVGIFHYGKDHLTEKFLYDLGVDAGFIKIYDKEKDIDKSEKIILSVLQANEAKGRRRSVRLDLENKKSTVGIRIGKQIHTGKLLDISCSDMGCMLSTNCEVPENSTIDEIIIKQDSELITGLSGTYYCRRDNKSIILFDKSVSNQSSIKKVSNFIRKSFEEEYREDLKRITFSKESLLFS